MQHKDFDEDVSLEMSDGKRNGTEQSPVWHSDDAGHDQEKELDLSERELGSIPPALVTLGTLTSLDLSRNRLTLLQGELFALTNLTYLNLDRNRLQSLDGIFPPKCGNLVSLSLCFAVAGKKQRELPGCLWQHYTLEHLDVRYNCIRRIPAEVANLTELRSLRVGGNRFQTLPRSELCGMSNLSQLDVSSSRMSEQELQAVVHSLEVCVPHCQVLLCPEPERQAGSDAEEDTAPVQRPLGPGEHPSLWEQLSPLSTPTLLQRLASHFGVKLPHGSGAAHRREVLEALSRAWAGRGGRREVRAAGQALPPALLGPLLEELRRTAWPRPRERPSVASGEYLTLARPSPSKRNPRALLAQAKTQRYAALFAALHALISAVDPAYAARYTMIAVTKGFQGSPHMDQHDISYQWVASLGSFRGGGELCIESAPDEVTVVDTQNRAAKVDGRFVHWVRGCEGERFSVVFFTTEGQAVPKTLALLPP